MKMINQSILSLKHAISVILPLGLTLMLCSCASQPKIVYVPTPVKCPAPIIQPEPDYPIRHLTVADKGNYPKISKAWVSSFALCRGALQSCNTQLEGYRHD